MIRCCLFGKNITKSQSPNFHNSLSKQLNIDLNYHLESIDSGCSTEFEQRARQLLTSHIDSANITYPYKETAIEVADILDLSAQRVGAANTLVSKNDKIIAYNTDYSGFIAAYKAFRVAKPGNVVLIGCGGVGKAVAKGLSDLGVKHISLYDHDLSKAKQLADTLEHDNVSVDIPTSQEQLKVRVLDADGLVNCTPVGHYSLPGTPIPSEWINQQQWLFDAVYTPIDTEFVVAAKHKEIATLSGFELFFNQATDAFELFTGLDLAADQLSQFRKDHFSDLR